MKSRRSGGFTLIEILVVIAVIALLAAILFPVFARARENARRASCQSNLKQMALGITQYLQDYDERYPGFTSYSAHNTTADKWTQVTQPYLKSQQILLCPSASKYRPSTNSAANYTSNYLMNGMLGCASSADGTSRVGAYVLGGFNCSGMGVKTSSVARPAQTILIHEGISTYNQSGAWMVYNGGTTTSGGPYGFMGTYNGMDLPYFRKIHLEGMNFAFADGHVKWYSETNLARYGNSVRFAGHIGGVGPNGTQYTFHPHNGEIDMQVVE